MEMPDCVPLLLLSLIPSCLPVGRMGCHRIAELECWKMTIPGLRDSGGEGIALDDVAVVAADASELLGSNGDCNLRWADLSLRTSDSCAYGREDTCTRRCSCTLRRIICPACQAASVPTRLPAGKDKEVSNQNLSGFVQRIMHAGLRTRSSISLHVSRCWENPETKYCHLMEQQLRMQKSCVGAMYGI